jgi:hypothetical protein
LASNPTSESTEPPDQWPFRVDFIDPLFAVALSSGLVALMRSPWFVEWRLPRGGEVFDLSVFTLGMATIIASWEGYHQSIKTKPLHGLVRFVLDVVLVLLYAVILVQYRNFEAVLLLLAVVYGLFVLWDVAKVIEYPGLYDRTLRWTVRYRRELVTGFWFAIYLAIWMLDVAGIGNVVLLIAALAGVVLYRLHKGHAVVPGLRESLFGERQRTGGE